MKSLVNKRVYSVKSDFTVLRKIKLKSEHKPTGFTRHFADGLLVNDKVATLKIVQYSDDAGFYLLHYDKEGSEITDLS